MSKIKKVWAREVIDSRGNPTIEVEITTQNGAKGRAIVPSGASTGSREALELRDGGKRFLGKGVRKAVKNVNEKLAKAVKGLEVSKQKEIDNTMLELDGTPFKKKLGANAILGVSMAAAHAAANEKGKSLFKYIGGTKAVTLPVPMMNIINGGEHADNSLDIQEFMIMPTGARTFKQAIQMGAETFHALKNILHKKGHVTAVGDEGGFAPNLKTNEEAIKVIIQAIKAAGYTTKQIEIAMDCAASEFYNKDKGLYHLKGEGKKPMTSNQLVDYYAKLVAKYPIVSIEDGLDESDWDGFKYMTEKLGKKIQIVGDDLFVTNPAILKKGIKNGITNSILIKVNQIGTLSETYQAIKMAQKAGYTAVTSHRSGETEDTTIADLAVALNTGQIKTGSMSRTDRIAKYNQLLRIEEELGKKAKYLGKKVFTNLKK